MSVNGSVYKRCGCRDPESGRRKGRDCELLARAGHGSWYLTLDVPADIGGQRRRIRVGGHRTRADAVAALKQLQAPAHPSAVGWTTGAWLRRWLAGRSGLRPTTRRMYESHLRLYLLPHLERTPLTALTTGELRVMFSLIRRQQQALGRPLSATTLHSIRCTLRAALNAAIREGLISTNPASWVELPTHRRPHAVVWTPARVEAWKAGARRPVVAVWTAADTACFLAAVEGDDLYPLFWLVAVTGLRRGEAAGLCWSDVDLAGGTLTVSRTLQEQHRRAVLMPPKSASSARTLALDRTTVAVLAAHQRRQHKLAGVARPRGFVFAHRDGSPYSPGWITHHFRALQAEHGLPPIRLHDLRHGAASLALASGADLKAIQDLLGHASIVLTADTYTSVLPEVARRTTEGIAGLILTAGRVPPGRALDSPSAHHGLTRSREAPLT